MKRAPVFATALTAAMLLPTLSPRGQAAARQDEPGLAFNQPETKAPETLAVTSSLLAEGQPIPPQVTAYGSNTSPPLDWSSVPEDTRSLVLILEDPDAPGSTPFVHWLLYNIPARLGGLPWGASMHKNFGPTTDEEEGRNSRGVVDYFGPKPPPGDPPHHYHFEIFALDRMLPLGPGADRQALLYAMSGNVLAKGQLVATFQAPR